MATLTALTNDHTSHGPLLCRAHTSLSDVPSENNIAEETVTTTDSVPAKPADGISSWGGTLVYILQGKTRQDLLKLLEHVLIGIGHHLPPSHKRLPGSPLHQMMRYPRTSYSAAAMNNTPFGGFA
jgi:hypothetical protein